MSIDFLLYKGKKEVHEEIYMADFDNIRKCKKEIYGFVKCITEIFPDPFENPAEVYWAANIYFDEYHIELTCLPSASSETIPVIFEKANAYGLTVWDPQNGQTVFPKRGKKLTVDVSKEELKDFFHNEDEQEVNAFWSQQIKFPKNDFDKIDFLREIASPDKPYVSLLLARDLIKITDSFRVGGIEREQMLREGLICAARAKQKRYYGGEIEQLHKIAKKFKIDLDHSDRG
ncbi:MAG: hypothetical protein IPO31_07005 [Candidatus Obscuribacter sp.]|nr:hypothetical protein [Candidatus Obscuribacter sp.]